LTGDETHAFSIADNRTAQIAQWDYVQLKQSLLELERKAIDLRDLGFHDGGMTGKKAKYRLARGAHK